MRVHNNCYYYLQPRSLSAAHLNQHGANNCTRSLLEVLQLDNYEAHNPRNPPNATRRSSDRKLAVIVVNRLPFSLSSP
jgi:hypothetical protein